MDEVVFESRSRPRSYYYDPEFEDIRLNTSYVGVDKLNQYFQYRDYGDVVVSVARMLEIVERALRDQGFEIDRRL